MAERQGEFATVTIDGRELSVYYEGITEHSPGFYGDRALADWTAHVGTHTVQSYWSHPNEGFPGDTCTFEVTAPKGPPEEVPPSSVPPRPRPTR